MEPLRIYKEVFIDTNHRVILKSGRNAGKSTVMAQKAVQDFFRYELDVLVTRANYGDLEGSMYTAIMKVITEEKLGMIVETKKKPLRIINKLNGNIIHFKGIGGSDLSRTRSWEPPKELSLLIIEEAQQLPEQANLDQAMATYRRSLNEDNWQIIIAFNPPRANSHWINEFFRMREKDDRWTLIWANWTQIAGVLNTMDIEDMLIEKETNPSNYKWMYLGITEGLAGGVYHTFNRRVHLISEEDMKKLIDDIGVHSVIIGVDAAKTIDKTAFVPSIILNNGQAMVTDYFYQDPIRDGELSNDRLFPYVEKWLKMWHTRWGIKDHQRIDMVFDTANADLRMVAQNRLPSRKYICQAYTLKNIIEMAQIMQNVFSRNVGYILDEGYFNYITNRQTNENPLVIQLESVIWDKNGKVFDKTVDNDATDALTYAQAFYFKNPSALYFPKPKNFYERSVK